jgi:hypothetical protein
MVVVVVGLSPDPKIKMELAYPVARRAYQTRQGISNHDGSRRREEQGDLVYPIHGGGFLSRDHDGPTGWRRMKSPKGMVVECQFKKRDRAEEILASAFWVHGGRRREAKGPGQEQGHLQWQGENGLHPLPGAFLSSNPLGQLCLLGLSHRPLCPNSGAPPFPFSRASAVLHSSFISHN